MTLLLVEQLIGNQEKSIEIMLFSFIEIFFMKPVITHRAT